MMPQSLTVLTVIMAFIGVILVDEYDEIKKAYTDWRLKK